MFLYDVNTMINEYVRSYEKEKPFCNYISWSPEDWKSCAMMEMLLY
jgi:hypothetical protein